MTRVIKAEIGAPSDVVNLADLLAEGEATVAQARQDAERIVADARAQAEAVSAAAQRKGLDAGFAAGRDDGYAEGRRQARQEAQSSLAADMTAVGDLVRRIVAELVEHKAELLDQARQDLLEFALELAAKVVGRVAAGDIAPAKAALEKVLSMAHGQAQVIVKVSPQQVEALRSHAAAVLSAGDSHLSLQVEGDAAIEPGGAKLVTKHGLIDATIRTQLDNIAAALLGGRGREPA